MAADGAILAVKPDVAEAVLQTLAAVGITRVLSIVAGLSTARLEAALGPGVVVRSMPNTPSLVGSGVAAISGGSAATADDLDWAEGILGSVGTVVRLPERHLDAVTGVSGSGPAYVYLVAEAMIEGGRGRRPHPRGEPTTGGGHHARLGPDDGGDGGRAGRAQGGGDLTGRHHRGRTAHAGVQGRAIGLHRGGGGGDRALQAAGAVTVEGPAAGSRP